MARGIDLTPNGVLRPGTPQDYRLVRAAPWFGALRGVTSHLRLWADWPTLQPVRLGIEDPANPGYPNLLALDAQIRAANADGLAVILMPYRYPAWANHAPPVVPRAAYRLPGDGHGLASPWAGFVEALWSRYVDRGATFGRVSAFELVNEPNLQLWPRRDAVAAVAEMAVSMEAMAAGRGHPVDLLAPSASDGDTGRDAGAFTDALLRALDRHGFPGGAHWVWSTHAYEDVERGVPRIPTLRAQLAGRWRGRAAGDGGPLVHVTEAGCRLSAVRARFGARLDAATQRALQARVLGEAVARLRATPGVGLLTQYTLQADPNYDCGLLEPDGAARPAFAAWTA
jgi:hypothetical protein